MNKIQKATRNKKWQKFRKGLKGLDTSTKRRWLDIYLRSERYSNVAYIRVNNYINALKRAGLIKGR